MAGAVNDKGWRPQLQLPGVVHGCERDPPGRSPLGARLRRWPRPIGATAGALLVGRGRG